MSTHNKGLPIQGDFCVTHLHYVVSCADAEIERALETLPLHDLNRLRKVVAKPRSADLPAEQRKAS